MSIEFLQPVTLDADSITASASELAALQTDPDHPVIHAFSNSMSDYWAPPATTTRLQLKLDGGSAVAVVWSGSLAGASSVRMLNSSSLPLSAGTAITERVATYPASSSSAHFAEIRFNAAAGLRVYRIVVGSLVQLGGAVDPATEAPGAGLRPGFEDESVMSPANMFHGRRGVRSAESAELRLTQLSRSDAAFDLRDRLVDGSDAVIRTPAAGAFDGGSFYVWGRGRMPEPTLARSLLWGMTLPVRYWTGAGE